jgi:putative hydrolase of the HAD superfamily
MIAPFPGALDTLQRLCGQGIRLALITNGNADLQRRKINRFGLEPYFDYILVEGEFGVGKPDARVYQHVLEQLKVKPNQAWMIGDNLEWDVVAPQRLGIFGVWNDFARKGLPESSTVQPDRIIHTITELV